MIHSYIQFVRTIRLWRALFFVSLTLMLIAVLLFISMLDAYVTLKHDKDAVIEQLQDIIYARELEIESLKSLLPIKAQTLDELIDGVAESFDLPAGFIKAIATVESNMVPTVINNANNNGTIDYGLMQLNSSWFNMTLWHDAYTNLIAACLHISMLRNKCDTWWQVAVAYNAGIGAVKAPSKRVKVYADTVLAYWRLSTGGADYADFLRGTD